MVRSSRDRDCLSDGHVLLPVPLCFGAVGMELASAAWRPADARQFRLGLAIGGAASLVLLLVALLFVLLVEAAV